MENTCPTPLTTAEVVKAARGEMSLREFANLLGVSYESIRLMEQGKQEPTPERLRNWYVSDFVKVWQMAEEILIAYNRAYLRRQRDATSPEPTPV